MDGEKNLKFGLIFFGLFFSLITFLYYQSQQAQAINSSVTFTIEGGTATPTPTPTPTTGVTPTPTSSSGCGSSCGGGSPPPTTGNLRITGDAFPGALVTILRDGATASTLIANSSSVFDVTFSALVTGSYTFSIYAQDSSNNKTLTISFSTSVIGGTTVTISGLLLSPIVSVPDSIKRPESLTQSGLAKHNSTVTTLTNSDTITKQATTNSSGQWSIVINNVLHLGVHTVSALVQDSNGLQSGRTSDKSFQVKISADLNVDTRVNLTDFSILMFSYGRNPPPNILADINDNGNAPDLVDFSIMMFYWTR